MSNDIDELCLPNLDMAWYEARDILYRTPRQVSMDELVSVANEALVKAAHRYDPSTNVPFRHYARSRVKGALLDELRRFDWAPRSMRKKITRRDEVKNALTATLRRAPSEQEVATELGVSVRSLRELDADYYQRLVLSLDLFMQVCAGETALLIDEGSIEEDMDRTELLGYLRDAIAALPDRLRTVIEGIYYHDRPFAEIASELGVSESRISQIRTKALKMIRDALGHHLGVVPTDSLPEGCRKKRRDAYRAAVDARSPWRARLAS